MMSLFRRLPLSAIGLCLVLGIGVKAQTETAALVAGRATVGIALTISQTVGGYVLSPAKIEGEAAKEIYYDGAMNPLDFDAEAAGFTYYSERRNEVKKKLADGEVYPVDQVTQVLRKAYTQRYLSVDFIKDLVARGGVLSESPGDALAWKGYALVAVTFKGRDSDRRFFFAEKKGAAPVFVGWETRAGEAAALSAGMCLLMETAGGEAETGNAKISQKIAYEVVRVGDSVIVSEDIFNPPAPTLAETFSGKAVLTLRIFPNGTGPFRDLRVSGRAVYSGRHDTPKDVRVNGKLSAGSLAGSQFVTYGEGELAEERPEAVVEGAFTIGVETLLKTEAEAQVYLNAVPESLRP